MTYPTLSVAVLAVLLGLSAPVLRRLRAWPIIGTTIHLVILTLVFDSLMIREGLVAYDPAKIVGFYLGSAPLEDFAYPIAAGIAMPVVWSVLERRDARRDAQQDVPTLEEPPA